MSVSQARACAVVDAGMKALSLDSGPPQLLEGPNVAMGFAPPGESDGSSGLPTMSFEGVAFENGGEESLHITGAESGRVLTVLWLACHCPTADTYAFASASACADAVHTIRVHRR